MRAFLIAFGISSTGDALSMMAFYWLYAGEGRSDSILPMALRFISAFAWFLAALKPIRGMRGRAGLAVHMTWWIVISVAMSVVAATTSGAFIPAIASAVVGVVSAGFTLVTGPSYARFFRAFAGGRQRSLENLTSMSSNIGRVVAGAVVFLLPFGGASLLYAIDAVTFIPLLLVVLTVKLPYEPPSAASEEMVNTVEGLRIVWRTQSLRFITGMDFLAEFSAMMSFIIVAERVRELGGGLSNYGAFIAATGVALMVGSALSMQISREGVAAVSRGKVFVAATLVAVIARGVSGLSGSIYAYLALYFLANSMPGSSLVSAELRKAPNFGSVVRARLFLTNVLTPGLLAAIAVVGKWIGLPIGEILFGVSIFSGVLILVGAYLHLGRRVGLQELFPPEPSGE